MRTSPQTSEVAEEAVKRCQQGRILLVSVLLLSAAAGLVLLIVFTTRSIETCNTPTCLLLLAKLQQAHNNTIDPCEDFYSYTCGNWEANNTQGMNVSPLNVFDVLLEENQLIMKRLIEEPQRGVTSSAKEKAVRFYTSCMNTEQIEARGAQPLKELIDEIGGWNITGSWKVTDFNKTLQILMERYNTFPFFKAYVGPNSSDPSTNIIQIDHPEFELPPETYFEKKRNYPQVLRSYYLYLLNLGLLMGGRPNVTSTYISLAFSFISNLQKIVTPLRKQQEKRMLFYHTTIREMQEKAPAIDWLSCLQAAFHPVPLNVSQQIVVHDMDYLKGMSKLIEAWQRRRDVLQIYMILCLVRNLSPTLDGRFQKARQDLADLIESNTAESLTIRNERWRKCLSETSTFFGPVLGKIIVQEIFPQKAKDLAELIFAEIKETIYSQLDNVKWMSYQARQEAKEKIYSLKVDIGYPDKLFQTGEVDDEYQELEIYDDNFFHNVVSCLRSLRKKFLIGLLNPHLQDNWEVAPWSVHSYYSQRRHAVVFPAGMFRSPFFHPEYPSAVNFGAMGVFMAHELIHSFYDYVLIKNCSACDMKTLTQGIDCLVRQYESYSLDGHIINGSFTLLENVADTGGLAIAYQAYQSWLTKRKRVKELPWHGISHHQLFFISFAHAMCEHQRLKGLETFLHRDPHSPPTFRVLGTLSNSLDFSKHFRCTSKSSWNPDLRCYIW